MNIMKKRISLVLGIIMLALAIVPMFNVNAVTKSYEKDLKVIVNGNVLKEGSTTEVVPGTKVTMTAATTSEVCKLQYQLGAGVINSINASSHTVQIPETAKAGETYTMKACVTYKDGTSVGIEEYKFKLTEKVVDNNNNNNVAKDIKVSVDGKELKVGSTTEVIPGTKVTMLVTPAENLNKLNYKLGDGVLNSISKNTHTVQIPETAKVGETYSMQVSATFKDGTSMDVEQYKFKLVSADKPVSNKGVKVTVNEKEVAAGSVIEILPGTKVTMSALESADFKSLQYKLGTGVLNTINTNTHTVQVPQTAKAGETYSLTLQAFYTDGTNTNVEKFTFKVVSNEIVKKLEIEPWMEENDETEELVVSLRNDSEKEGKANKNIYELNETVTYYIDYKNGGKDIDDDVTIILDLPLDFDVVDYNGGKLNGDDEIEWVLNGLEEGEAGTIVIKVKYTDLKKSRDDANTIYPAASILKGKKVKDVSTVINYIITEYNEELDIEHKPYMYGDANADTFRPDYIITRAEGALVLARIFGLDYENVKTITTKYTDINTTYLAAQQAITVASQAGLINGYEEADGTYTYRPNAKMTKAEFMKILARMIQESAKAEEIDGLQIKELDSLVKVYDDSTRYYIVDGKRVYTHWAIEEITLLARLNMLPLSEDNNEFELDEKITRAEVAQLINFYLLRAPAEVTSRTKTGFSDVSRKHDLAGDIIEATRGAHTFSITTEATEVEE